MLAFLPDNTRIEDQATGRTARSWADGSGILIVNDKNIIESLKNYRDKCEDERINNIKNKQLFNIKFMGELFQRFCIKYYKIKSKLFENDKEEDDNYEKSDESDISENEAKQNSSVCLDNLIENIKEKLDKKEFNKAKLKDIEEKWGIWIKRNNLENCDVVGKEEEIFLILFKIWKWNWWKYKY